MAAFGRMGRAFARMGALALSIVVEPPVEGEAPDSLLLFDSEGVTLLHLGLI